jgi:hypothetical protein
MKINIEIDMTPEEAKELFVPSDKQTEFMTKTYDAYIDAVNKFVIDMVDPHNYTGINPKKGQ